MELKDVIHYYIGQKLQKGLGDLTHATILGVIGGMVYQSEYQFTTENCDGVFTRPELRFPIGFSKPVLRKLEDMTGEDMIGLLQSMAPADMEDKPTDEDYGIDLFHNDGGNMVDSDLAIGADYNYSCFDGQITITEDGSISFYEEGERARGNNLPKAYHYLLSRGFDLFGLIASGQAVDVKTITI